MIPALRPERFRLVRSLREAAAEAAQTGREVPRVVQRWAHEMVELSRGDHHTYYETRRAKSRPSLASQLKRKL